LTRCVFGCFELSGPSLVSRMTTSPIYLMPPGWILCSALSPTVMTKFMSGLCCHQKAKIHRRLILGNAETIVPLQDHNVPSLSHLCIRRIVEIVRLACSVHHKVCSLAIACCSGATILNRSLTRRSATFLELKRALSNVPPHWCFGARKRSCGVPLSF